MKLGKWNYKTKKYDKIQVPDNWNVKTYVGDLNQVINCAQCGKEVVAGDTYTSKEIHTKYGIGFMVCEECYNKEIERWYRSVKDEV